MNPGARIGLWCPKPRDKTLWLLQGSLLVVKHKEENSSVLALLEFGAVRLGLCTAHSDRDVQVSVDGVSRGFGEDEQCGESRASPSTASGKVHPVYLQPPSPLRDSGSSVWGELC